MLIVGPAQNNYKKGCCILLKPIDTICQNHFNISYTSVGRCQDGDFYYTEFYVMLMIHCMALCRGGVHIIFQVVLGHRKEYGLTRNCQTSQ